MQSLNENKKQEPASPNKIEQPEKKYNNIPNSDSQPTKSGKKEDSNDGNDPNDMSKLPYPFPYDFSTKPKKKPNEMNEFDCFRLLFNDEILYFIK